MKLSGNRERRTYRNLWESEAASNTEEKEEEKFHILSLEC